MNTLTNTKPYYFKTLYNNYVTAANEAYDRYDIDKTVKLFLSSLSLILHLTEVIMNQTV